MCACVRSFVLSLSPPLSVFCHCAEGKQLETFSAKPHFLFAEYLGQSDEVVRSISEACTISSSLVDSTADACGLELEGKAEEAEVGVGKQES